LDQSMVIPGWLAAIVGIGLVVIAGAVVLSIAVWIAIGAAKVFTSIKNLSRLKSEQTTGAETTVVVGGDDGRESG